MRSLANSFNIDGVIGYPHWKHFPPSSREPAWAATVVAAFTQVQQQIDSQLKLGLNSNAVLAAVRPALVAAGFDVEAGKKRDEKRRRPVLFGERGSEALAYEVDAFHPEAGIALEIEAGRGVMGNAVYRDLIQSSLLLDAEYLVLAVAAQYHYTSGGKATSSADYTVTRNILDAIPTYDCPCLLKVGTHRPEHKGASPGPAFRNAP